MEPLFRRYPRLRHSLPYVGLGQFPTPVERLAELGRELDIDDLYIKQDGLSGKSHGASKVRKLEILLGDAVRKNATETLTLGYAGSNHAAATSLYAHQLGMKSVSLLLPQQAATYVCRNLLLGLQCDAELLHYRNVPSLLVGGLWQLLHKRFASGRFPYVIPAGGSSPMGVLGYVNAAFELEDQIGAGILPEPDRIYIAAGTLGAAAGLALGLLLTSLRTQVTAVRVVPGNLLGRGLMFSHLRRSSSLLRRLEPTLPRIEPDEAGFEIRNEFVGPGYARPTRESVEAAELIAATEGIELDGTYTAKALAALIGDAKGTGRSGALLFWNTFNPDVEGALLEARSFRNLPRAFHRYFEGAPAGDPQQAARPLPTEPTELGW